VEEHRKICYLKKEYRNSLTLAIGGMTGSYLEEPVLVFKFFCCVFILNFNKHKHPGSREMLRKCPNPCLEMLGKTPGPFEKYLEGISYRYSEKGLKVT
jgi:hypothetical protein